MTNLTTELKEALLSKKDPFEDIYGQDFVKQEIKSAMIMGRHIVVVGPPGIGKTTLAKNLAKVLPEIDVNDCSFHCDPKNPVCPDCLSKTRKKQAIKKKKIAGAQRFVRIQGSPDLTAEDLIGDIDPIKALEYGPLSLEAFTPGKIFKANNCILFFDELNRCPEKLQNALLQILEEGKATIGSYDLDFEANFIFIGTMNPDDSSTERLNDVLLDRFDLIYMDYPESLDIEKKIVLTKGEKIEVEYPDNLLTLGILFIRILRQSKDLEKLPSVRASLGIFERAQANALIKGKKVVDFEDIRDSLLSVLAHRIKLKPSIKYLKTPEKFIEDEFDRYMNQHSSILDEKGGSL